MSYNTPEGFAANPTPHDELSEGDEVYIMEPSEKGGLIYNYYDGTEGVVNGDDCRNTDLSVFVEFNDEGGFGDYLPKDALIFQKVSSESAEFDRVFEDMRSVETPPRKSLTVEEPLQVDEEVFVVGVDNLGETYVEHGVVCDTHYGRRHGSNVRIKFDSGRRLWMLDEATIYFRPGALE